MIPISHVLPDHLIITLSFDNYFLMGYLPLFLSIPRMGSFVLKHEDIREILIGLLGKCITNFSPTLKYFDVKGCGPTLFIRGRILSQTN